MKPKLNNYNEKRTYALVTTKEGKVVEYFRNKYSAKIYTQRLISQNIYFKGELEIKKLKETML